MNFFSKFFGSSDSGANENEKSEFNNSPEEDAMPIDELFIFNFKKNGGKFIYCETSEEVKEQIENIFEENDWFEREALCFEKKLYGLLQENRIIFENTKKPSFLLSSCESLVTEDGSILFSSTQIKQHKPHELPANIVVFATTSQIVRTKSDGLSNIKHKYVGDYPTNITAIKYFKEVKEENFTQYGSVAKNIYLLLLEDL